MWSNFSRADFTPQDNGSDNTQGARDPGHRRQGRREAREGAGAEREGARARSAPGARTARAPQLRGDAARSRRGRRTARLSAEATSEAARRGGTGEKDDENARKVGDARKRTIDALEFFLDHM